MKVKIILFSFVFLLSFFHLFAQSQDTTLVRIETTDGNEFIGSVVSEDELVVVLKTEDFGEISIRKLKIKSRENVLKEHFKEGEFWFDNPQSTRYFWAPNAFGLKPGEGYYQNIYVLWNQFSVGVTKNFSIGAGIIPLFLFDGTATPVFITPKFSIPIKTEKVNVGGGALLGVVIGEEDATFGIVYGLSTFGTSNNNVTIGLGYGFAGGDWADAPLINVSGLFRLSGRGYLILENYYINSDGDGGGVIGLGGRWIIKKASLDFMLGIPFGMDSDSFVAIPAIGFTIPF